MMKQAREDFFRGMNAMMALTNESLLVDNSISSTAHNEAAKILRNGVAVSAYSALESYLKEIIYFLSVGVQSGRVQFPDFPEKLQRFLTVDAVSGFNNYLGFLEKSDQVPYHKRNIHRLSMVYESMPEYSSYGFSPRGSNIGHEDIKKTFAAFGLVDIWGKISSISSSLGGGLLSPQQNYKNLARTRHTAAHVGVGGIELSDLITHISTALNIGIAADALSFHCYKVYIRAKTWGDIESSINNLSYSYRLIDLTSDGKWIEKIAGAKRATKVYSDRDSAISGALARSDDRLVVLRDQSSRPFEVVGK